MTTISAQSLKALSLFHDASDEAIAELIEQAPTRLRTYSSGDIVARQGAEVQTIPILLAGTVRAQMMGAEGKRLTMDTLEAPNVLASAFVYSSDNKYPVAIEAIEDATVLHLDRESFLSFMSRYPSVMRAYLGMISDRCSFLTHKINTLNLQSLRERLISYTRQHGSIGKQVDLALLLGVTRPALARVIGELVDEGILTKEHGEYRLPS